MTTKDSAGVFPSCDPLFATLTAVVLERDIVIVQTEAEMFASVSKDLTCKFLQKKNLKAVITRATIDADLFSGRAGIM